MIYFSNILVHIRNGFVNSGHFSREQAQIEAWHHHFGFRNVRKNVHSAVVQRRLYPEAAVSRVGDYDGGICCLGLETVRISIPALKIDTAV